MNTLTIILIVLTATLLIANIVMFVTERTTTKNELNFDKSKTDIILLASKDEDEIIEGENMMSNKYNILYSTANFLKTEHDSIYIKAYLVKRK